MHPSSAARSLIVWLLLVATAAMFGFAQPPQPHVVSDPLGFTLRVPGEFVQAPEIAATRPAIVYCFRRDNTDAEPPTVVVFEKLSGVIDRKPLDPSHMPKGYSGRVFKTPWKSFDIDAFENPESIGGFECVTFNAQVPLRPYAIQVSVFGPASRKAELLALLQSTLAGFDGPSNWVPSVLPASISGSPAYGMVMLGLLVVGLILGLLVLWFVGRRTPQGTVLLLAGLVYVCGVSLPDSRVREVYMLRGGLKMLGVTGALLGVVMLVIKPRRPADPDDGASAPTPEQR